MVEVITSSKELHERRREHSTPIGFVPTMGNLHEGHLSLLNSALQEFNVVYFSIFVNPKQFGPNEDFHRYPRTLENDIQKITSHMLLHPGKQVIVFAPHDPSQVFENNNEIKINVEGLDVILEGAIRPGHFQGVTTVVFRLFELLRPSKAYFGLKDYQQLTIIKMMVKDLKMPIIISSEPIIRDERGLALSSRNQYLDPEQKEQALILISTLKKVSSIINGSRANLHNAQDYINNVLVDQKWNYLEMRDAQTLDKDITSSPAIVILGVYQIEKTRLLDNLVTDIL